MIQWFFRSSQPPAAPSSLMENSWRKITWGEEETKKKLKKIEVRNPDVEYLRILVHGPVGAGKSSFINSISCIFRERIVDTALAESGNQRSFTKLFKAHHIRDDQTREPLRFVLCDIMGLQNKEFHGSHPDDLIKILHGQIKAGHKFNPATPCSDKDSDFISNPPLSDRIHCLVSIIPADKVALMEDNDFNKMKLIRDKASEMDIPQLTMLTKVDQTCPEVQKDIQMVYRSKKVKEKMQECSNKLGVPMNCIFPVKCYHEEIELDPDMNVLLLSALTRIVNSANDYVEMMAPPPANERSSRSDQ